MPPKIQFERLAEKHIDEGWLKWVSTVDPNGNTLFSRLPPSRLALKNIVSTDSDSDIWLAALMSSDDDEKTYFANVHLGPIDWIDRKCAFGRLIGDPSYRGMGLGTILTESILSHCFRTLGMHKVYTSCSELNISAHKSNQKAGMTQEAVLKNERFQNGKYVDSFIFSAWSDDWSRTKSLEK